MLRAEVSGTIYCFPACGIFAWNSKLSHLHCGLSSGVVIRARAYTISALKLISFHLKSSLGITVLRSGTAIYIASVPLIYRARYTVGL